MKMIKEQENEVIEKDYFKDLQEIKEAIRTNQNKAMVIVNSTMIMTYYELKMDEIATYVKPKTKLNNSWEEVPEDIKNTFDKLGIPEAEKKSLGGVGAQYDSEVVYHSIKEELLCSNSS